MSMSDMIQIQEIKLLKELDDLTGLLQIMVFLTKFERGNISHFIKDLRLNQQPTYRTMKKLMDIGLVEVKMEPLPHRGDLQTKYYYLTETGRKLAVNVVKVFDLYKKMK